MKVLIAIAVVLAILALNQAQEESNHAEQSEEESLPAPSFDESSDDIDH
ncbi:hypothetical protein FF38_02400 [Lucilia cuprina]|uniref:Uncharacterized protein n=1 Tax=Lucilia cuprina TaxID=7375 RepID=A0A0L0CA46_LUCCU|nr:hypothetical protein FF38_02400 [Lucilia cuprina]